MSELEGLQLFAASAGVGLGFCLCLYWFGYGFGLLLSVVKRATGN